MAIEHRNVAKIDEQFRELALCREKWERQDYRERTIKRALESANRETLTLSEAQAANAGPNPISLWDRAIPFRDIEEAPLEFIIPGLIVKDETTMMTGDFGSFKTYMSYFFADVSVKAECS